jgi:hypothetical protein
MATDSATRKLAQNAEKGAPRGTPFCRIAGLSTGKNLE